MSIELFVAFLLFAVVTLFTPGPNNIMLMATGLNFGFRRAQPHALGVALGVAFMALLIGFGLGAVFSAYPMLYTVLKFAGAAYLLYLAWMIMRSGPLETENAVAGRPITFLQAVAFQWVNPKAWVMVLASITTYAAVLAFPFNVVLITLVFAVIGIFSSWTWILFGTGLRSVLRKPRAVRIFNFGMAVALVGSLYPVVTEP